ncbi:hypothetical protein GCM10009765_76190 [Fodinicola feengrottensis]|uniref:Uncharacterized protein n=1 Tax=Fodinicola feengrottensis TaxID=435914 RepID=A0ABP4V496_9ACTN
MTIFGFQLADRRDEAVAAVLAGAVVVILGFASGAGIRPGSTTEPLAVPPAAAAPADPGSQAPPQGASSGAAAGGGGVSGGGVSGGSSGVSGGVSGGGPVTGQPTPSTPSPSSSPQPTPQPTCPPGLVGSLPVVGPLVAGEPDASGSPRPAPVPALLGPVPVLGPLVAPATPDHPAGLLSCPVGFLVGQSCCATATTAGKSLTAAGVGR